MNFPRPSVDPILLLSRFNHELNKMILACGVLLLILFNVPVWSDSEQQFAKLEQCELANGYTIKPCRIGYRTFGRLSPTRDNIIIFPTWFTGTTKELIEYDFIGPGKMADTDRYHVIAIDALANGVSSSPSNSPGKMKSSFPEITIADMVSTQYVLLKEVLDISHVHAVMGISMGGMQTFQWVSQYPAFMDNAVAIDGSPKMTSYDLLQWQTHTDLIKTLQQHDVGEELIMDLVTSLGMLTSWSPDYVVERIAPEEITTFIHKERQRNSGFSVDDYLAQLNAVIKLDIYAAGDQSGQQIASRIKANMLVVSVTGDLMVNPTTALKLADALGAEKLVLDSNCGHWATTSCEQEQVVKRVNGFLNKSVKPGN